MTSNRPAGRPSSGKSAPPTSRRSARQQRLANREAGRAMTRASTRGSGGGGTNSLLLWSVVAVVIAAVLVGSAFLLSQSPSPKTGLTSPNPAAVTFPANLAMSDRTLGDPNATVTLDVYSDFQCPGCGQFAREYEPKLIDAYVKTGKVKLVYHDFVVVDSIPPVGNESRDAANAALCANDQGKFWQYHELIFWNQPASEKTGAYSQARLLDMGRMVPGLDTNKFDSCVKDGTYNSQVLSAKAPAGVNSTPGIFVNNKYLGTGLVSYDTVTAALDVALAAPSPSAPAASPSAKPS